MSAPVYTPLGQRLQERTEQLQSVAVDEVNGWAHGHLSEAMMHGLEQFASIVDPPDPAVPWEPIFNLDLCPSWALPWLAQCAGVRLPQTINDDQARQLIRGLGFHQRGTVAAIKAAGDAFLVDPKIVYLRERDAGNPYRLEIVVDENSLPESDRLGETNKVRDAYASQIPAGIIFDFRTIDGWDYEAMIDRGGTYEDQTGDFLTYRKLSENIEG